MALTGHGHHPGRLELVEIGKSCIELRCVPSRSNFLMVKTTRSPASLKLCAMPITVLRRAPHRCHKHRIGIQSHALLLLLHQPAKLNRLRDLKIGWLQIRCQDLPKRMLTCARKHWTESEGIFNPLQTLEDTESFVLEHPIKAECKHLRGSNTEHALKFGT